MAGPVVHLADLHRTSAVVDRLAASLAPRFRILSILPRGDQLYQVHVMDILGVLAQFGFERRLVVAEGMACASALLLAAWHPNRVGALALIDAHASSEDGIRARSLRDCPPEWTRLREEAQCPILDLAGESPALTSEIERLLSGPLP